MRWIAVIALTIGLSSCWLTRAYRLRKMQLNDHTKLPSVRIEKSSTPFHFYKGSEGNGLKNYLDSNLVNSQTAAFVVIRNDSILYENYFNGFEHSSILPSNSMAKSFTGTLAGMALDEGKIKSLSDPVTNYLPELLKNDPNFSKITIQHLLDMRSGINFTEGTYTLKDDAIRIGLRRNLKKNILRTSIAEPPGRFRYQSINTQLLGVIIERATGKKLYDYIEEKLWQPLGMESDATWNIDSKSHKFVLASAGLNAIAIDFAKLGRLYLKNGMWEGTRLLNQDWVETVSSMDSMEKYSGYKFQWWSRAAYRNFPDSIAAEQFRQRTANAGAIRKIQDQYRVSFRTNAFGAIGFLNQALFVYPEKNLIILRLGLRWQHPQWNAIQFLHQLAQRL